MENPFIEKALKEIEKLAPRLIKGFGWELTDSSDINIIMRRFNWDVSIDACGWLNSTCPINKVPHALRTKVRLKRMMDNICKIKYDCKEPKLSEMREKPYWLDKKYRNKA